jgi:hypothetical protein
MNTQRILPTLAVAGALAVAALAPSAAGASTSPEAASANWSGYVVGAASSSFSNVSGSWVEPTADCSAGEGDAAFWVGLGGAGQESGALEQIGTEADCTASGGTDYFAWYELVPSAPVRLDLTIQPGDHVSAGVSVSGSEVTVSLTDQTSGASTTKTLQMSNPDTSSAEWIAEAPSTCSSGTSDCQPLPLDDFGSVTFTSASATAGGHTGTISDPSWTAQPVALNSVAAGFGGYVSQQSGAGASPGTLSSDGSSFAVAWSADGGSAGGGSSSASDGSGGGYGGGYGGSGYGGGAGGYGGYGYGGGYGGYGGYGGGGYGFGGYGD